MPAGKSKSRWKEAERETASALGTNRVPNNGFGQPDLVVPATDAHPQIAVQVKTKATVPGWFTDAINQAALDADGLADEAIPAVVVVHAPGRGIKKRRYVILQFDDAVKLLGDQA